MTDTTIVNVAPPSLIAGLHAPLDQAIWVLNADPLRGLDKNMGPRG